jgi:hypothetical protein
MKSPTPIKVWSLDRDKEYFVKLWRAVTKNWKQSLVIFIGLVCLLAVTLLYIEVKVVDTKIWQASSVVVVMVMAILLLRLRVRRRAKVEKVVKHNFDPVSLGTLWFSFALILWISQKVSELSTQLIAIFVSLGALAFLVAVFNRSMRKFINTKAAAVVITLTLFAVVFGFALGWLPALSQVSGVIREVIMYFGFLWVVVMLLVIFRDFKSELARTLFVVFFLFGAVIKFCEHDIIGIISGIVLTGIAVLLYLVATGRLHPYGKVS